ncbi:MAG TPA: hypothetical protein VLG92_02275 [Candidatus Saccharimonadia bacterium]|nr:hypothetical protein [Candidatus Saccharimonadia bacterium]
MSAPLIILPTLMMQRGEAMRRAEAHLKEYDPVAAGFEHYADMPAAKRGRLDMFDRLYYGQNPESIAQDEAVRTYVSRVAAAVVLTSSSTGTNRLTPGLLHRATTAHYQHEGRWRFDQTVGTMTGEINSLRKQLGWKDRRQLAHLALDDLNPSAQRLITLARDPYSANASYEMRVADRAQLTPLPTADVLYRGLRSGTPGDEVAAQTLSTVLNPQLAHEAMMIHEARQTIAAQFPDFGQME